MKTVWKRLAALILAIAMIFCCLSGCGTTPTVHEEPNTYTREEALRELKAKVNEVTTYELEAPFGIIDFDSTQTPLADIDTFEVTVRGNGEINIEVATPSELSGNAPDDLVNVWAKGFNNSHATFNGKTVSVTIRKISSGELVTYVSEGNYRPDLGIPSSYAPGEMLKAKGFGVITLSDRLAGNTAGILMKKDVYDEFVKKHGEPTFANVLEASLAGELVFGYTNPYTSATGLNSLTAMLSAFDPSNPLSDTAAQKLLAFQEKSPPVAYTTGVLRTQAANNIISTMVMEEQAYINTPELKNGYVFTPGGIRHDHPAYTFDYVSSERQEVARMFVEYCLSADAQKIASQKGFNLHNDYVGQDPGLDGAGYLAAQRIWKQNKDGGRPVIAVFAADVSISMEGKRLAALKDSLIAASSFIGADNYIGLISFSDDVYVNLKPERFDGEQRARFVGAVNSLQTVGNTATYDAVLVALKMLQDKAEEIPNAKLMLFLLSDGERTSGYRLNDITNIVGGLRVPIYSIGYDMLDAESLRQLSAINEAVLIDDANPENIINRLRDLFNVQL